MEITSVVLDSHQGLMFKAGTRHIFIYYNHIYDSFCISMLITSEAKEPEIKHLYEQIGNKLGIDIIKIIYTGNKYIALISKEEYLNFKAILKLQKLI